MVAVGLSGTVSAASAGAACGQQRQWCIFQNIGAVRLDGDPVFNFENLHACALAVAGCQMLHQDEGIPASEWAASFLGRG